MGLRQNLKAISRTVIVASIDTCQWVTAKCRRVHLPTDVHVLLPSARYHLLVGSCGDDVLLLVLLGAAQRTACILPRQDKLRQVLAVLESV